MGISLRTGIEWNGFRFHLPKGADALLRTIAYDRDAAAAYAERWALGRNPAYYNFDALGGDCTNFISQCVFAGCGVMNYTPETGWFYESLNRRAPAWTGVNELYRFLTSNRGPGPYAETVSPAALRPGDVIQLGDGGGDFYHSLLVLGVSGGRIYIACHTADSLWRPLDSYVYRQIRYLHILGARKWN